MAAQEDPNTSVVERLVRAVNDHDLEALVACFADDYVNETPAHPRRGFVGRAQVRRNWSQLLGGIEDLRARVPRSVRDGDTAWTEWEMSGTRPDGAAFEMRGVVIFGLAGESIGSARFYLEPRDADADPDPDANPDSYSDGADADAAVRRIVGTTVGTAGAATT